MADPFEIFNQQNDSDFANIVGVALGGPIAFAIARRKDRKKKMSAAQVRWANEYPIYDDASVADIRKQIEAATINYNGHPSKSRQSKINKEALANYIADMRNWVNDLIRAEKEAAAQAEIDRKAAEEEAKRNSTQAVLTSVNTGGGVSGLPTTGGSMPTGAGLVAPSGGEVGATQQPEGKGDNKKLLLYGGIAVGGIVVLYVLSKLVKK